MTADSAWFEARAVEALFVRGLGGSLEQRTVRRIREAGIDLSRPLKPAYPREVVLGALTIAAEELAPGESIDRAHRLLGERLVRGFVSGWRGKMVAAAARSLGAERALSRVVGKHPTPTNFLEVEVQREAPGAYAVELNWGGPSPELLRGILIGVLGVLGAKNGEVLLARQGEPRERFEVRFRA